jgi:predicted nucleic acid-binding Zn ribbon protein
MFKRDVQSLKDLLLCNLREQGLETPLLQKRLVDVWPQVAGPIIASYTLNTYIYNQTLFVRLSTPSLRADLSMMKQQLVDKLNAAVGQQVITDIKFG